MRRPSVCPRRELRRLLICEQTNRNLTLLGCWATGWFLVILSSESSLLAEANPLPAILAGFAKLASRVS